MNRKIKWLCLLAEVLLLAAEGYCVVKGISFLVYPLFFLIIAPIALLLGSSRKKDEF